MKDVLQLKGTDLKIKDIDSKQGIVVGYFSAFDVVDTDGDVIVKGAFAKTIQERGPKSSKPRIKHLLDHNKMNAVATILDLEEDNIGLRYESKAGRHTNGQDWLKMCEDGIITEHSTTALYPKGKIIKKERVNYMQEAILLEGSSLQYLGANGDTPIVSIKEYKFNELCNRMELIEKAIRNGTYSDTTFVQLEKELGEIKQLITKLLNETTEPEPLDATTQPSAKSDGLLTAIKQFNQILKA
jgi:HK97 family phage prohead protease